MTKQDPTRKSRTHSGARLAAALWAFVTAFPLVACAQVPAPAAKAATPAAPAASTAAEAPPAATGPSSENGSNYVIGPGDVIQVFVWRNPELSVSVPVRPDGKISTPLVEDMIAVGKTPSQLARDVEKVLAEYVRQPQVNIIVSNAQSAFNQVKVIGQVRNPSSLPYREGMTAMDAVLAVGGLTEFASGNRARLMRKDAAGNEKPTRLKLDDLMKKGRAADNPPLKPGDLIVVPEAMF
jgi:polysaccharide export outer membrane protein